MQPSESIHTAVHQPLTRVEYEPVQASALLQEARGSLTHTLQLIKLQLEVVQLSAAAAAGANFIKHFRAFCGISRGYVNVRARRVQGAGCLDTDPYFPAAR